jgi:hypothetical protein
MTSLDLEDQAFADHTREARNLDFDRIHAWLDQRESEVATGGRHLGDGNSGILFDHFDLCACNRGAPGIGYLARNCSGSVDLS